MNSRYGASFCDTLESGGQHDRDSSRDRAGGGSSAALFKNAFWDISFGEPPLASSQRTRWRCPPDSGGRCACIHRHH